MKPLERLRALLGHASAQACVFQHNGPVTIRTAKGSEQSDDVFSDDDIVQCLRQLGGSSYVDDLGAQEVRWKSRLEPAGALLITASRSADGLYVEVKVPSRASVTRPSRRSLAAMRQPVVPAPPAEHSSSPEAPGGARETAFGLDAALREHAAQPPPRAVAAPAEPTEPGPRAVAVEHARPTAPEPRAVAAPARPAAPEPRAVAVEPAPAVHFGLELLLAQARELKASDLHIIAGRPVALRVAGELVARGEPIAPSDVSDMASSILPRGLVDRFAREGSADFALVQPGLGRARVNVSQQSTGVKLCFRLIPLEVPTLASLGLPAAIGEATHHHQGLIVITGPSGHGKTSTLAAIVDVINSESTHHVITVEDPIEFVHQRKRAMMSQREVGTHTKSFEAALKASLREDPEIIVVGELRDTETVRTAVAASETGHLVIGTMNTPSASKTIDRLIDLFPPADQSQVRMTLAGGLRLIVSQRLVPSTDGGLAAAAELLPGSIPLWALIRDNKTFQIPSLQQRGKGLGIVRIDDSLAELVRQRRITREAAMRASETFATSGAG